MGCFHRKVVLQIPAGQVQRSMTSFLPDRRPCICYEFTGKD